jgi:(1->4)-alpha-D-glucan 1-alpha-D-glucosylmutase
VGVWPASGEGPDEALVTRVREYMRKAIKEANVHTSWVNDNEAYDRATTRFVSRVLTGPSAGRFLGSFLPFQARVARLALSASLSQVLLKIASPGVPDTYQGCELWDLRLVDPDNRAPVDFDLRARLLAELEPHLPVPERRDAPWAPRSASAVVEDLLTNWHDGRIKLWVTAIALRVRRAHPDLFIEGDYLPLESSAAPEPVAFARLSGNDAAVVVAPRLLARLGDDWTRWAGAWKDASVALPASLAGRRWLNVLTGERLAGDSHLPLCRILAPCPVALLLAER